MTARHDAIRASEVWSENRDVSFVNRLASDIEKLQSIGLDSATIRKVISTYDYVRVWTLCPPWMFPVKRLPQGMKWKDGKKYAFKGQGNRSQSRTYILLDGGDDLYVNGVMLPGMHISDKPYSVIKNWRSRTAVETVRGIVWTGKVRTDPDMESVILDFWHENGVPLGWIERTR